MHTIKLLINAPIRTRASEPQRLIGDSAFIGDRRLRINGIKPLAFITVICSMFMLILLFLLILNVYVLHQLKK